jgi:hypothetical protein
MIEIGAPKRPDAVYVTAPVPLPRLWKRDLKLISEIVPLQSGARFHVEAHGVWLTESEVTQLDERRSFSDIAWSTPSPPRFPPR